MKKIEELHDLKVNHWYDFDKYHEEPLLDYVWQVANEFLPTVIEDAGVLDDSKAPAIFANRYFESKLSIEERYIRFKEIHPNLNCTFEEYANNRKNEKLLDASFKDKFLSCEELLNTIEAFGLDISKFWYLLLFVHDYVEDICTDSPKPCESQLDLVKEFSNKLSEATCISIKAESSKSYTTTDKDVIHVVKAALNYFINAYYDTVNNTGEEALQKIKNMGLKGFILGDTSFNPHEKRTLGKTYKEWKFAEIFQFFLEDKKAKTDRSQGNNMFVSKDKLLFISRLLYVVGYEGKDYYDEYNKDANKNRKLSNVLRKYSNTDFPPAIPKIYLS